MGVNPYPQLPHDRNNIAMQNVVQVASVLSHYTVENATASSLIGLTPETTLIEIAAIGASAAMRWVSSVAAFGAATSVITVVGGTANYDHIIPVNTVRQFAIPIEKMYQAPSSMVGANVMNGLYNRVATKSMGIGSVLLTEY